MGPYLCRVASLSLHFRLGTLVQPLSSKAQTLDQSFGCEFATRWGSGFKQTNAFPELVAFGDHCKKVLGWGFHFASCSTQMRLVVAASIKRRSNAGPIHQAKTPLENHPRENPTSKPRFKPSRSLRGQFLCSVRITGKPEITARNFRVADNAGVHWYRGD